MSENSILSPTRTVQCDGVPVEVRELRAIDMLQLLRLLGAHAEKLANAQGGIDMNMGRITSLIAAADEVAVMLVLRATGQKAEWLSVISAGAWLDVLDAALEINFTEALEKKIHAVGERGARLFGMQNRISPSPSSSSSPTATPAPGITPPARSSSSPTSPAND